MGESAPSQQLLERHPRLAGIVGWLSLATLLLGVFASFLGNVSAVRKELFDLLGIDQLVSLHYVMVGVVVALFASAFLFGWLWFVKRFFPKVGGRARRLLAGAGVVAAVLLAVATNILAIPNPPDVHEVLAGTSELWRAELLALNVENGGLRTSRADPNSTRQVWSTAQSLLAVLTSPNGVEPSDATAIREHFEFFEKTRLPGDEGWGYMESMTWGVTEIVAWVALAHIASMNPKVASGIWGSDQRSVPIDRVVRDLDLLKRRQLSDGGWSPINSTADLIYGRTYSTTMALSAMLAARGNDALADVGASYDREIEAGIRWLLLNYTVGRESWVPNPRRPQQLDSFPGLTAQVLSLLARAQPEFGYVVQGDGNYERARNAFFDVDGAGLRMGHDPRSRTANDNNRTHDSDSYLGNSPYTVESSTFLWWPWSLTLCIEESTRPNNDATMAAAATRLCGILLTRANDAIRFAKGDPFTYVMAENLLSINTYLAAEASRHPIRESGDGSR